jgi:integrase
MSAACVSSPSTKAELLTHRSGLYSSRRASISTNAAIFYASGLIAHGADVVTLQRALGHAKATTTLNTYSHLWPRAEAMLTEALNASAPDQLLKRNSTTSPSRMT